MENDWIMSEGRLQPRFADLGGVLLGGILGRFGICTAKKHAKTNVYTCQKANLTFATCRKANRCVQMFADKTKLMLQ